MKLFFGFLFLCCLQANAENIVEKDCMEEAKTQIELNHCAALELKKANTSMENTYNKIIEKYSDDTVFIEKLRASQDSWAKYRDAQLDMIFPHNSTPQFYGSIYPLCLQLELTRFTQNRVKVLNRWLTGIEEGDICGGSIKAKANL
jgi:uncharacterized protein YecT (DUF1311 family)